MNSFKDKLSSYQRYLAESDSQTFQLLIGFLSLTFGIGVSSLILYLLPVNLHTLEKARQLGIVSRTILDGYPKYLEIPYYIFGVLISLLVGMTIFLSVTYFRSARRSAGISAALGRSDVSQERPSRFGLFPWLCISLLLLFVTFDRKLIFYNWYWGDWGFFFEEGIYLRWINELLHGKILYKDVYFYGGPFLIWPQYWLMKLFRPSIALGRLYVYFCNFAGYLIVFAVLRQMVSRKTLLIAGAAVIVYLYYPLFPGVHQTLGRFAICLLPLYLLYLFFFNKKTAYLLFCGITAGFTLFFSQELGVASFAAIAGMVLAYQYRERDARGLLRHAAILGLGVLIPAVAVLAYFSAHHALTDLYEALVVIPGYYSMGVWGFHFPNILLFLKDPGKTRYDFVEFALAYWPILLYVGSVFFCLVLFLRRIFSNRLILFFGVSILGGIIFQRAFGMYSLVKINNVIYPAILLTFGYVDIIWSRIPLLKKEWKSSARKVETTALAFLLLYIVCGVSGYIGPRGFLLGRHPYKYFMLNRSESTRALPLSIPRTEGVYLPPKEACEVKQTVDYIKENTSPDEPIYVFPFAPAFYFLTDRESPSRYPVHYAITRSLREQAVEQLSKNNVKYVVCLLPSSPVLGVPAEEQFPEIYSYIQDHYELEKKFGDVDILKLKG